MNELLGRPITGDVSHYSTKERVEPRPISELLEALDGLLEFPEVEAVRWTQYSPYFNDGDVCEFGVNDPHIKFVGQDEGGDYEDGFSDDGKSYPPGYWDTHYKSYEYGTRRDWRTGQVTTLTPPADKAPHNWSDQEFYVNGVVRPDIEAAFRKFSSELQQSAFEIDLHKHFGDPARVTATREGFEVEDYDHD